MYFKLISCNKCVIIVFKISMDFALCLSMLHDHISNKFSKTIKQNKTNTLVKMFLYMHLLVVLLLCFKIYYANLEMSFS